MREHVFTPATTEDRSFTVDGIVIRLLPSTDGEAVRAQAGGDGFVLDAHIMNLVCYAATRQGASVKGYMGGREGFVSEGQGIFDALCRACESLQDPEFLRQTKEAMPWSRDPRQSGGGPPSRDR